MLTLPIKKKWFDMILSGEKTEEYREIKPYWTNRLLKPLEKLGYYLYSKSFHYMLRNPKTYFLVEMHLKNGYAKDAPTAYVQALLNIRQGRPEWGAEPGKEYYVFEIKTAFLVKEKQT